MNPWPRPPSRAVPGLTLPVSHAPESSYHTPSALRESIEQWFQKDVHNGRQVLVGVVAAGTVRDMDVEYRVTHGRV